MKRIGFCIALLGLLGFVGPASAQQERELLTNPSFEADGAKAVTPPSGWMTWGRTDGTHQSGDWSVQAYDGAYYVGTVAS